MRGINGSGDDLSAEVGSALIQSLQAGGEEHRRAVACLDGLVWRLALEPVGCRVVQVALETSGRETKAALVTELHGHVREAILSPHANYVIQKTIEVLPVPLTSFVITELFGVAAGIARQNFGCRVLCRLLEHSATNEKTASLVDELLVDAGALCRHNFGHYVVQAVLEHGLLRQRRCVAAGLQSDLMRLARNRNACYVIEKALLYGEAEDCSAIAAEILQDPDNLVGLAKTQVGCYIVKALLKLPQCSGLACAQLRQGVAQLNATKYGQRLLEDCAFLDLPEPLLGP